MKFLFPVLALLVSASPSFGYTETLVHKCVGARSKLNVNVYKSDNLNAQWVLKVTTHGALVYSRRMNPPELRDPSRKFPENLVFYFDVLANTGGFDVYSTSGAVWKHFPVDPRTGVKFGSPITMIHVEEGEFKLNDLLVCN